MTAVAVEAVAVGSGPRSRSSRRRSKRVSGDLAAKRHAAHSYPHLPTPTLQPTKILPASAAKGHAFLQPSSPTTKSKTPDSQWLQGPGATSSTASPLQSRGCFRGVRPGVEALLWVGGRLVVVAPASPNESKSQSWS